MSFVAVGSPFAMSKRPQQDPHEPAKRPRGDSDVHMDSQDGYVMVDNGIDLPAISGEEYEVQLGGASFVIVEKLHARFKRFFKRKYGRNVKDMVTKALLQPVVVTKKHVAEGLFAPKPSYAGQHDYYVARKDDVDQLIADALADEEQQKAKLANAAAIAERANAREAAIAAELDLLPEAPAIIDDPSIPFFVDSKKNHYHVEMRGEREADSILFDANGVGDVFKRKRFSESVLNPLGSYEEGRHYKWCRIDDTQAATTDPKVATSSGGAHNTVGEGYFDNAPLVTPRLRDSDATGDEATSSGGASNSAPTATPQIKKIRKKVLFLTFSGLLHALVVTKKSSLAKEFRVWVEKNVFKMAYGTEEQKIRLARSLLNQKSLNELMKICQNQIACIYLIETTLTRTDGGKKIYKIGYSKSVKERMDKHVITLGRDCVLNTVILIPEDSLSSAEARLKAMSVAYQHNETEVKELEKAVELLALSNDDLKVVRTMMKTVAEIYYGTLAVHEYQLEKLQNEHALVIMQMEKQHQGEISKWQLTIKDLELEHKDALSAKDREMSELKLAHKDELSAKDRVIAELRSLLAEANARALQAEIDHLKSATQ